MITSGKRSPALLFVFAVVLSLLCPLSAAAAEEDEQVVRVGWYQSDMFQEGTSDEEEKSGYCYDYLQNVSNYTGWKYEYVYGEWTELFHALENGEIDVLAGVSVTDERKETMLFPDNAMGTDQYYLYKRADDTEISAADLSTLSGSRIGGIEDNRATAFTEQWIEENGLDAEIVYYDSFDAQETDFESGRLDLMTQTINNVLSMDGISIVAKVGEEPFYLAVSKDRPDLLSQLNAAVTDMLSVDPFILQNLQYKNYGTNLTGRTLTAEETQWLAEHPTVRVGYMENYLPYCATDENGQATGVMTDVLAAMVTGLNLQDPPEVEYKAFDDYYDMTAALQAGEVDIVFPVGGDLWELEQNDIDASNAVLTGYEVLFYRGNTGQSTVSSMAVNRHNGMQIAYAEKNFPEAEPVYCDSIDDCLEAVLDGEADATLVNTFRSELVTGDAHYNSLSYRRLGTEEERCFGVRTDETALLLLLNRGLRIVGSNYCIEQSYQYTSGFFKYTTVDFLREHAVSFSMAVVIAVTLVIGLLVWDLYRKEKRVREKEAYISQVQTLNSQLESRQAQLEQATEEAQAASRAKTTFLFNMSHDIRTPMNAIIGYTELMERNADDQSRIRDYLKKLRTSGNFLLSLINNVLEMARIESGKVEVEETECRLGSIAEEMYSLFDEQMREKGITFTKQTDVHTEYVLCDHSKVREIYLNILSNACKYTPSGGTVTLTVTELPSDRPGYALLQTVLADTGIGMSKEYLPHLFEEFTREQTSTESRQEGTGLGMPIVKRLVGLMGGTIEVESELGKGTVFTLTLYLKITEAAPEVPQQAPEAEQTDFTGRRILLAEDNDLNAEIAEEILAEAGFAVERAADGAICVDMLQKAEAGYYDVILMDIQMPNMNGYEAAKTVRAMDDAAKANIPILAMTANAFEEDRKNALEAGMNGHLGKPIDVPKLMEALEAVLK